MRVLEEGRIVCRVRITGSYKGRPFVYTDPIGSDGSQYIWKSGDPSTYWWKVGNFSCDCNRRQFVPKDWDVPEGCGKNILINKIQPIDYDGPVLELNEALEKNEEDN
jgi:hypothetical protein